MGAMDKVNAVVKAVHEKVEELGMEWGDSAVFVLKDCAVIVDLEAADRNVKTHIILGEVIPMDLAIGADELTEPRTKD